MSVPPGDNHDNSSRRPRGAPNFGSSGARGGVGVSSSSSSGSRRAELDELKSRVSQLVSTNPAKAATILTEWMRQNPARKKTA